MSKKESGAYAILLENGKHVEVCKIKDGLPKVLRLPSNKRFIFLLIYSIINIELKYYDIKSGEELVRESSRGNKR